MPTFVISDKKEIYAGQKQSTQKTVRMCMSALMGAKKCKGG